MKVQHAAHTAHGTKRTRKKYNFSFLITVLFSHSQCLNDPLLYPFCLHPMSDFQSGGQAAADPANRAWLGRRLQLGERRRVQSSEFIRAYKRQTD